MMKIFGLWDVNEVKVEEKALSSYIFVTPLYSGRTGGKNARGQRIWSQKTNIVERLANKLMVPGHRGKKHKISSGESTGKATTTYKIVKEAFNIIEKQTKQNPIQVFVTAVENAAPREEVTSIEYGGARYSKAVDIAPLRRIDLALRWFIQGAYSKSFNSKKKMAVALAEEILGAYRVEQQASNAISKKLELERQADSSR